MKIFIKALFSLAFIFLFFQGCVQFKTASLYDGQEAEPAKVPPKDIGMAVEPVIFSDDATNFWVTDDERCTSGGITTEAVHSGDKALKVNWNRDPSVCEWAGFGIGWDDWVGKDLSDVFDAAAIQFYVRTQEGKMFGLPCVLTLEDYSGRMGWSYAGLKYFEKYYIDEEWQKAIVPLNTFDIEKDGLDLGNIKQLSFELQAAGGIYLDDVSLVYYTPEKEEPWLGDDMAGLDDPLAFPLQLFGDEFINDNGWGIHEDQCQKIEYSTSTFSEGNKSIHAKWDKDNEDCYHITIGISWHKWFRVDMSKVSSTTMVEFDIKNENGALDKLPVNVGFEDYERALLLTELNSSHVDGGVYDNTWRRVRIPLSDLQGNGNFADIKQLIIRMEDKGEIFLDNISLVRNSG